MHVVEGSGICHGPVFNRKSYMKLHTKLLGIAFVGGILGLIAVDRVVAWKVNEVIYPKRVVYTAVTGTDGAPLQKVTFKTVDGLTLTGWHIPSRNRATIILQHGWHANSSSMRKAAMILAKHGYGVLLVDFRGQGQSEGDIVSLGLNETKDSDAAVQFVLQRADTDKDKIGLLGNSMGAATGILATAHNPDIHALAVEGAFAELRDEVAVGIQVQTPLPPRPLDAIFIWFAERQTGMKLGMIAPVDHISAISPRPVLIMHGADDQRVFPESAQRLFAAAGEPKELWIAPGAAHIAIIDHDPAAYEVHMVTFFDQALLGKSPVK